MNDPSKKESVKLEIPDSNYEIFKKSENIDLSKNGTHIVLEVHDSTSGTLTNLGGK